MSAASVTVLPRRTPPNILVVEGDARIRCLVSDELRAMGFKVLEASSAGDALTVLDAVRIDLLFVDLDLQPTGSGLNVVHHIRGTQSPMPIIVSSHAVDTIETLEGLGLFIRKPYPISQILDLVMSSLNWPRPP